MTDRWLDLTAAAQVLGVHPDWLYKRCTAKTIPHHKVGRRIRFTPTDLAAIERSTSVPVADPRRLRSTG